MAVLSCCESCRTYKTATRAKSRFLVEVLFDELLEPPSGDPDAKTMPALVWTAPAEAVEEASWRASRILVGAKSSTSRASRISTGADRVFRPLKVTSAFSVVQLRLEVEKSPRMVWPLSGIL